MADQKTFLLGVGCQKGGTTWLYSYLQAHPNCDLGFIKEYHLFDVLFHERLINRFRNRLDRAGSQLRSRSEGRPMGDVRSDADLANNLLHTTFYLDPNKYAEYFNHLYEHVPETQVVGDITPAYSMLNAKNFKFIRDLLEPYGFQIKVIFLMRDPVDRCYSSAQMYKRSRLAVGNESIEEVFRSRSTAPQNEIRTRYERTITALEETFAPQDIYYGFYESLFCEKGLAGITDFLDVTLEPADFSKRVNSSPDEKEALSAEAITIAREFYNETYRFCAQKFGADFIDTLWLHASKH